MMCVIKLELNMLSCFQANIIKLGNIYLFIFCEYTYLDINSCEYISFNINERNKLFIRTLLHYSTKYLHNVTAMNSGLR